MTFDFSNLKPVPNSPRFTDPIQIFRSLRMRNSGVNDLWLAQAEALQPWYADRDKNDIAITLNTGAGKTLVGLLIAQSIVNDTGGLVLYACNSIQLVEQTRDKAVAYGMEASTYINGAHSNNLHAQGKAPCITTYQALFNGKSKFFRSEVEAVVFDDCHTAEAVLRDQFTLHVTRGAFDDSYLFLGDLFRDYFRKRGNASTYDEILRGASAKQLLVPPTEIRGRHSSILGHLQGAGLDESTVTLFAWEHLKDHLDMCAFLVSGNEFTITPPIVPVRTLPYFRSNVRRIYLSATLNANDSFARTFGRIPTKTIAPTTTAGACERMIIMPALCKDAPEDVTATIAAVPPYKVLVMTPSYPRAKKWESLVTPPPREEVTNAVNSFKASKGSPKLLLTARYDGVDLPGDACRVMVIDDLPSGTGPLEKFLWESLRMNNSLRTTIASRIVQTFGRISRGMSDHGVVLITGERLIEWLSIPKNLKSLPQFLQKQLQLGRQLSESQNSNSIQGMISSFLGRDGGWIDAYERFMAGAEVGEETVGSQNDTKIALAEAKFAEFLWRRQFQEAATSLNQILDISNEASSSTAAWHKLWLAMTHEFCGEWDLARRLYSQAHGAQPNLPLPDRSEIEGLAADLPPQARLAALQFQETSSGQIRVPNDLDASLTALHTDATFGQVEESLRVLGLLLGFESSRPDKEVSTGPDVLWKDDQLVVCIDAKSNKQRTLYRKTDEVGQMHDHIEWVNQNVEYGSIVPLFVGPKNPASRGTNPPPSFLIATKESFAEVSRNVCDAYRDVASQSLPLNLAHNIAKAFEERGLTMEGVLKQLGPVRLDQL